MALVAGDQFLLVHLYGGVRPVLALDGNLEFQAACLLFRLFGFVLFGLLVSRCFLGALLGVVLLGFLGGLAFFLGVGLVVVDKELSQVVGGAGAVASLSVVQTHSLAFRSDSLSCHPESATARITAEAKG